MKNILSKFGKFSYTTIGLIAALLGILAFYLAYPEKVISIYNIIVATLRNPLLPWILCGLLIVTVLILKFRNTKQQIDKRKPLPRKDVEIGTYQTEDLAVAIRAKIVLNETTPPTVDYFLERARIAEPYCPRCSRPLDNWRWDWTANGGQRGYQCQICQTQIEGTHSNLLDNVKRKVREDFQTYWTRYKTEIKLLTNGRPHKFKLPE